MANDCIFCKIINREIPARIVYEDSEYLCFEDIHPQARFHLLVVPKEHIASLEDGSPEQLGKLLNSATLIANRQGFAATGYRTTINTGPDAGQTVFHLHLHLLGGEPLSGSFGVSSR